MTIKEFINHLSQFDPDSEVVVEAEYNGCKEVHLAYPEISYANKITYDHYNVTSKAWDTNSKPVICILADTFYSF